MEKQLLGQTTERRC